MNIIDIRNDDNYKIKYLMWFLLNHLFNAGVMGLFTVFFVLAGIYNGYRR
jgi:hypothetical protein